MVKPNDSAVMENEQAEIAEIEKTLTDNAFAGDDGDGDEADDEAEDDLSDSDSDIDC